MSDSQNSCKNDGDDVQLRKNLHANYGTQNNTNKSRSVSLVDRLSKLQYSQNSWQSKVPEKDVRKFTVEGKMQLQPEKYNSGGENRELSRNLNIGKQEEPRNLENGNAVIGNMNYDTNLMPTSTNESEKMDIEKSPVHTPVRGNSARSSFRSKKTPKPMNFKSSPPVQINSSDTNSSDGKDQEEPEQNDGLSGAENNNIASTQMNDFVEIELPSSNDQGFSNFFSSMKEKNKSETIDKCDFDLLLPAIAGNRHNAKLQHHKKDFAKTRKGQQRKPPTKNPLKSLAERADIRQSYTENSSTTVIPDSKTLDIDTTKKHALAENSKLFLFC